MLFSFQTGGVANLKKQKSRSGILNFLGRRLLIALLIVFQIIFLIVLLYRSYQLYWLTVLLTALSVITALHLMMRPDKSAFKLSLVFLILLFPLFGGAFYWIFHFQTASVGFRKQLEHLTQRQKENFQVSTEALERAGSELSRDRWLLQYLQTATAFPVYQNTQTKYFPSGRAMLTDLLDDLRRAERYVFMEYFIIEEGIMWDSILEVLKEKAAAGVDVRIIYDDFGCLLTLPADYAEQLHAMGIQCLKFNKFHPFLTSLQNNRDHRKITVIDGKVAYTGGVNLADEYIDEKIRFGRWKDNAMRLCGEGTVSFTIMFLQMWGALTGHAERIEPYLPSPHFSAVSGGWVQPYSDSPMDKEDVGEHVYMHAINRTGKYLYITTPYLMLGDELMSALKFCAKSGVDVRMITPTKPDKPMVHFTTRSYYRELIDAGVRIYEFQEGFIHAKTVISDGDFAVIGTVNWDFRSLYLHFECGTCLYATQTIADMEADFRETLLHSREVTASDCKTNVLMRLLQEICRLFAPLM